MQCFVDIPSLQGLFVILLSVVPHVEGKKNSLDVKFLCEIKFCFISMWQVASDSNSNISLIFKGILKPKASNLLKTNE